METNKRKYDSAEVDDIASRARTCKQANGLVLEIRPVPGDNREHVLDSRVYERARARIVAGGGNGDGDVIAFRTRPNKETHSIEGGGVNHHVVIMDLDDRGIPLHVYTPEGHESGSPALIFYHGGGFMVGNIGQYENALKLIAKKSGSVVVYPEYRLSPETMFPGGVEDCVGTYDWVVAHAEELGIDEGRIAIAGDSAGGSLSNAVVLERGREGKIGLLVLIYPLVDGAPVPDEWSYELYPAVEGQRDEALSRVDRIKLSVDDLAPTYTHGNETKLLDPLVSAAYAGDVSMFPRTLVVASEFDYLRYQDELFARKLQCAGVDVRAIRYGGCDHGFFETCGVMPQVEDLCNVVVGELEKI